MAEQSILSDELLRQLMAVGQVDILVGVPTLNNAATVAEVVRTIHLAFSGPLARQRTVMIHSDGGSTDGTPDIVRGASIHDRDTVSASLSLRTIHRISTAPRALPGLGGAVRTFFAAADLLQAKAVAVFEPDVTNLTPEWVAEVVRPVHRQELDYLLPIHPRRRFDAPLVSQLLRPMLRATFGCRLRHAVGGEFACSGRVAAHCLEQDLWSAGSSPAGIELWLLPTALASGFRVGQVNLGPRAVAPRSAQPALPELFQQVVGALFGSLMLYESFWMSRQSSEPVPTLGAEQAPAEEDAPLDSARLAEAFRSGVADLSPILARILEPETHEALRAAASPEAATVHLPDPLWVRTVYDFAAAHRHGLMHRDHLLQALVPPYLGRTASFVAECATHDGAALEDRIEALGQEYERCKPYLVERWNSAHT